MPRTPSSRWNRIAFFGPTPSSLVTSATPGGTFFSSCSSRRRWPVRTSSVMYAEMSVPMPGSSFRSSPSRTMSASGRLSPSTVRAAFW